MNIHLPISEARYGSSVLSSKASLTLALSDNMLPMLLVILTIRILMVNSRGLGWVCEPPILLTTLNMFSTQSWFT